MEKHSKVVTGNFLSRNWQKILAGLFWLAAIAAYFAYSSKHSLTPLDVLKQIAEFARSSPWGALVFIVLYTVRPIFLFSAALLTIGAGALFGPIWGTLYAVIGANLGATLAYLIGRFFGEGVLPVGKQKGAFGDYLVKMRTNSFETVFLMRLLFLPYDLVNYLAGILRINYWAFLSATILGSIPGTISFVLFGASSGLDSGSPKFDWRIFAVSVAIFLASIALSKFVKKKREMGETNVQEQ